MFLETKIRYRMTNCASHWKLSNSKLIDRKQKLREL